MGAEYIQPRTMEELRELLPTLPERTAVLAGGTDLMIQIRDRHPDYDCILSLWSLAELRKIEEQDGWLRIGAMVTHAAAAEDSRIGRYFQGLRMSCSHVGSQQVRNKGTLGGSLMNASPAGDIAPCVFLYGGEIEVLSGGGSRRIPVEEFFSERGKPVIHRGEILTAIWLPIDGQLHSCFRKLGSREEVTIAQISLCAAWKETDGRKEVLRAFAGAIDQRPVPFSGAQLLGQPERAEEAAEMLSEQIREIRLKRTRPPKLKITEAEQLYKERAAKGVVYDVMELMGGV